jgi:cytoskeleton protein RodZ
MSEETQANPSIPLSDGETAGQLLRKAREATGLHVAALAVAMKVPVKKLEALEADRYAELPDAVFVRALAASVCRTLKVDPAPILGKLPRSSAPRFDAPEQGVNMPLHRQSLLLGNPLVGMLKRPPVLAVLGLLLAALVVVLWPASSSEESAEPVPVVADRPDALPSGPPPEGARPASNTASAPVAEQALSTPTALPAQTASGAVVAALAPTDIADTAGDSVMTFTATDSAWVRVSDSKGVVRLEKTLAAGESAGASGDLPLSVVVGNVAATTVSVRGQPYPIESLNKNNVARFEVK